MQDAPQISSRDFIVIQHEKKTILVEKILLILERCFIYRKATNTTKILVYLFMLISLSIFSVHGIMLNKEIFHTHV